MPVVASFEPELKQLSDAELRKRSLSLRYRAKSREPLTRHHARGLCPGPRGGGADDRPAAFRRADPRRHRHAPSHDRRDADRRRQNAHGHAAALSRRAHRPRRSPGHGERLSGRARRRLDGADLSAARPDRRRRAHADERRPSAARPTPATSPTARPRNSASTFSATGCCCGARRKGRPISMAHMLGHHSERRATSRCSGRRISRWSTRPTAC